MGNEYESLYVARLLLDVLLERLTSITLEPPADQADGVECFTIKPDGSRVGHQCKRENGTKGKWSVADLHRNGVLGNAYRFINEGQNSTFFFASADKVSEMPALCERARQYTDVRQFVSEGLSNAKIKKDFAELEEALNLDRSKPDELALLRDFLMRFTPVQLEIFQQREQVETIAHLVFYDPPHQVVQALTTIASTRFRTTLHSDEILRQPAMKGMRLRELAKDATLGPKVAAQNEQFVTSLASRMIGGTSIGRSESKHVIKVLNQHDGPKTILLHGTGGVGKSGVVYEVFRTCVENGTPVLAMSLDQMIIGANPEEMGKNLGLPSAPQLALAALAGSRNAVLIIDQLDVLRWTAHHSAAVWAVCQRMMDSARHYPNLKILAVCRTFDVQDDPRIRQWADSKDKPILKIEVAPLSLPDVRRIILDGGFETSSLSDSQLGILRLPQNLSLYLDLRSHQNTPDFKTTSDLLRAYWRHLRSELGGDREHDLNQYLDAFIKHVDLNESISVPEDVLSYWTNIGTRLRSAGVIALAPNGRLIFTHQSHLDFVSAQRMLGPIRAGTQSLLDWLKSHDQSLFRRGQLRQLLSLLRDDDSDVIANEIDAIIRDNGVRYHIKHLVLSFLGDLSDPTDVEVDVAVGFPPDPITSRYADHLLFHRHIGWFDRLVSRGIIRQWYTSEEQATRNRAILLMGTYLQQRGTVAETMLFLSKETQQLQDFRHIVSWRDPSELTDRLFRMYVKLLRLDPSQGQYVQIGKTAEHAPARGFRMARLICLRILKNELHNESDAENPETHQMILTDEVSKSVLESIERQPAVAWRELHRLLPIIENVHRRRLTRRKNGQWLRGMRNGAYLSGVERFIIRCVVRAGRGIVKNTGEVAWPLVESLLKGGRVQQRAGLRIAAVGPKSWADRVITSISKTPSLLVCGPTRRSSRYGARRTGPARNCLRYFGKTASDLSLAKLVSVIRSKRETREVVNFRRMHEGFMDAIRGKHKVDPMYFQRTLLATQYCLLSAIPSNRLTATDVDHVGVLKLKFGSVDSLFNEPPTSFGGFGSAPISDGVSEKMTASNWFRLIRSPNTLLRRKRYARNHFTESSPDMFANQLRHAVKARPSIGIELISRLHQANDLPYISAIASALASEKGSEDSPEDRAPVPRNTLESLISHFSKFVSDRGVAMSICGIIASRSDGLWSDASLTVLSDIAKNHHDPEPGYTISGGGVSEAAATAINCCRGVAARTIAELLWARPELLGGLQPAIDDVRHDSHPAVRAAAARIALPLYNIDRQKAADFFVAVHDHENDDVLSGYDVDHFLSFAIVQFLPVLTPLLERMIASDIAEVAKTGAAWAMCMWMIDGRLQPLVNKSLEASSAHRLGLAETLAHHLAEQHGGEDAIPVLRRLLDDDDEKTHRAASGTFWRSDFYKHPLAERLLMAFVDSKACLADVDGVFRGLKGASVTLTRFAVVIELLVTKLAERSVGQTTHAMNLPDVLLRLYEQSESSRDLRRRCLDAWDTALRYNLSYDVANRLDD